MPVTLNKSIYAGDYVRMKYPDKLPESQNTYESRIHSIIQAIQEADKALSAVGYHPDRTPIPEERPLKCRGGFQFSDFGFLQEVLEKLEAHGNKWHHRLFKAEDGTWQFSTHRWIVDAMRTALSSLNSAALKAAVPYNKGDLYPWNVISYEHAIGKVNRAEELFELAFGG